MINIGNLEERIRRLEDITTPEAIKHPERYSPSGARYAKFYKEDKHDNFQLSFPLDVMSKKIVTDLMTVPVVTRIVTTAASTSSSYGVFFTSIGTSTLCDVSEVHGTASSVASTLQVERLQGSEAPGTGDDLLLTAFNLASTAYVVQFGSFGSASMVSLSNGDRLSLKPSGALTSLQDVQVTISLKYA